MTQARTLSEADRVVRDYLTLDGEPDAAFVIVPDLGDLDHEVSLARSAQEVSRGRVSRLIRH